MATTPLAPTGAIRLLIGENPKVIQMSFCSIADPIAALQGIKARGGRVVLVNPRRVETLTHVGELLQVKPDSDVYLLAALLCELERLGHWDAAVLARHGANVEALRAVVRQYPPGRVAPVVGLGVAEIEALARDFGAARRASAHASTGINMGRQGTLAYWLMQRLVFVTGNLDRAGGNVLSIGYYSRRARAGRSRTGEVEFLDTPLGTLRKPQPPVFPWPGNPVLSVGGETRLRRALDKLELLVVIDLYRDAAGEHAHYLLPPKTRISIAGARSTTGCAVGGKASRPLSRLAYSTSGRMVLAGSTRIPCKHPISASTAARRFSHVRWSAWPGCSTNSRPSRRA